MSNGENAVVNAVVEVGKIRPAASNSYDLGRWQMTRLCEIGRLGGWQEKVCSRVQTIEALRSRPRSRLVGFNRGGDRAVAAHAHGGDCLPATLLQSSSRFRRMTAE